MLDVAARTGRPCVFLRFSSRTRATGHTGTAAQTPAPPPHCSRNCAPAPPALPRGGCVCVRHVVVCCVAGRSETQYPPPLWAIPMQLQGLLNFLAKCFSPFDHSTGALSVLDVYWVALRGIHLAFQTAISSSPTPPGQGSNLGPAPRGMVLRMYGAVTRSRVPFQGWVFLPRGRPRVCNPHARFVHSVGQFLMSRQLNRPFVGWFQNASSLAVTGAGAVACHSSAE